MMDWVSAWNWMQVELMHVEQARETFDAAFDPASKATRLDKANAAVEFSRYLCHFLTGVREKGVFDAMHLSQGEQDQARDQLVNRLDEFLAFEEFLLERAGLKREKARAVMQDVRAIARPTYPHIPKDIWDKRVKQAIDVACLFPKSGVLLVTRNIFDYVSEVRKKYKWVTVAVVGTVDGLSTIIDPTTVGSAKVSYYIAMLMGMEHKGGEDSPPGVST